MKIYRLLRSNKESGPYSAEELVAMGLKPYDLLWADGRSAAWRYPSEIEALRAFAPAVEEQPYDRFYKKPKLTDTVKSNVSKESIVETIAVSIEKKQKPKIKITADWSKVETKKAAIPVHEIIEKKIITDRKVSWENAWLNWEQEKKTATEVSKIPLGKYVAEKKEDAVLETKFSASLDDIKSQYIENILHSKKKTENFNIPVSPKYIMAAALCLFMLFGGIWMGSYWSGKDKNLSAQNKNNIQQPPVVDNSNAPVENNNQPIENANADNFISTVEKENTGNEKENSHATFITIPKKENQPIKNIDKTKTPQQIVNTKPAATNTISDAAQPVIIPSGLNDKPADNPSPIKKYSSEKTVNDYVRVSGTAELTTDGADVKVNNTSDIAFDLVVIDVEYFDSNNHYKKGETIYIKNLQPGKAMVVRAPADAGSVSVKPHVSILSSDAKNIYLVGE